MPGYGSRSLNALPSSRLELFTHEGVSNPACGLIDVTELEERALATVRAVEDELMSEAESWWSKSTAAVER